LAFPSDKKNKRWIWKAYDRDSRRCVSWVVGGRDHVTLGRLWERIARPGCIYYTDNWSVYNEVIPPGQHVVGKAATQLLESDNANTRHRVARFTRRTKVVSRSEKMIDLTMRLWAYFEQGLNFAEYQKKFMCILG
jgi:insertion element IS1 protein InsB